MATRNLVYSFQMQDFANGIPIAIAGGLALICLAGSPRKATLFDPDTGASLANPVSLTRGGLRFATADSVETVDIFGFAPDGGFFTRIGAKPSSPPEITYRVDQAQHVAIIPFAAQDLTAASENDTGLDFTSGSVLLPDGVFVRVTTLESGKTLEAGLLSSESGGDADGLVDAVSLAAAGSIVPAVSGTPTLGALLVQNFATTPAVNLGKTYPIGATAKSITLTPSSATAAAQGYLYLPFIKPLV